MSEPTNPREHAAPPPTRHKRNVGNDGFNPRGPSPAEADALRKPADADATEEMDRPPSLLRRWRRRFGRNPRQETASIVQKIDWRRRRRRIRIMLAVLLGLAAGTAVLFWLNS